MVQDFVDYIPDFRNVLVIREIACDKLLQLTWESLGGILRLC